MSPGILQAPSSPSSLTFTASPTHPPSGDLHPSSDQVLISTLSNAAHTFLQPPPSLHIATLVHAKRYLDPLATSISQIQEHRLQTARKKRKRGDEDAAGAKNILRLRQVHLEGFDIEQIWEQARRVLDATRQEVERCLPEAVNQVHGGEPVRPGTNTHNDTTGQVKMVKFNEDGFEVSSSDLEDLKGEDLSVEGGEEASMGAESEEDDDFEHDLDGDGALDDIEDDEDIELGNMNLEQEERSNESPVETFIPDKNGLNDGFFSIDDFNRQSEFLEQQDARGDPNDGVASDEEDIDWDADPMSPGRPLSNGKVSATANMIEEGDDSEEDGPTFGNADLNAPDTPSDLIGSDPEDAMEDTNTTSNTNDIKYADFFAPPPRKATKFTRMRALPKTQPPQLVPNEDDIQRTISAVRRDLFEDDLSPNEESDQASDTAQNPDDPLSRRSNHQKRQAALAQEIRRLEAANVAKRDWTLSGEARAAERPINSLLEEDLEFERTGKPVPVITNEVSEDIEALIKRRILAREFDEVLRRRPDSLALNNGTSAPRRGRFELEDSKPEQSLAEMYEAEYLKSADPTGYMDKRDEKLKRQHEEIDRLWKDVSGKLDALTSWHYKPKPAEAGITVVADVPTVSMEDARPSGVGVGDMGTTSMLAPQEVYKPGEKETGGREKGEVVVGGVPVGREEMTREEKVRRRRREKERIKKAGGGVVAVAGKAGKDGKVERGAGRKAKEKEREEVVGALRKGGVRVIGKKGEIRDVEGKKVNARTAGQGGGGFKL
ncbi:U3 snoRNP protein [Lignoscripta atroalba]|nr:U3 snoRNP protein [Lignoscripta atroalba]